MCPAAAGGGPPVRKPFWFLHEARWTGHGCDACVARAHTDVRPGLARSRDCVAQCPDPAFQTRFSLPAATPHTPSTAHSPADLPSPPPPAPLTAATTASAAPP